MLCAVVLCLPALALRLHSDDFHVLVNVARDPFDGFRFERGTLEALERRGWWLPGTGHLYFFRPLSSLTHWLDLKLWPDAVIVMRLHSIGWYALLVASVCMLHRRLIAQLPAASLGGLLFAVDGAHALSVGWLASRNTVLSTLFGVVAVWLHALGRGEGRGAAPWLAPVALLAALLSGELGVSTLAYLLAYEVILGAGKPLRRVARLLPYGVVTALWWMYRSSHGYGAGASLWYRDVTSDPLGLLLSALWRVPLYLATQATLPVLGVVGAFPVVATAAALALLVWLARPTWALLSEHAVARFYLLGAALSALPLGTTRAQDRLATFVSIGVTAALALWLNEAATREGGGMARSYRALRGLHLIGRPMLFVVFPFVLARVAGGDEIALEAALPKRSDMGALLINPPASFMTEQPLVIRRHYGRTPPRYCYALYAGRDSFVLRRVDGETLELRADAGLRFSGLGLSEVWSFAQGERRRRRYMSAEVVEVDQDGAPTAVRFHFDAPLKSGNPLLLTWQAGKIRPTPMLAIGESRAFPLVDR